MGKHGKDINKFKLKWIDGTMFNIPDLRHLYFMDVWINEGGCIRITEYDPKKWGLHDRDCKSTSRMYKYVCQYSCNTGSKGEMASGFRHSFTTLSSNY